MLSQHENSVIVLEAWGDPFFTAKRRKPVKLLTLVSAVFPDLQPVLAVFLPMFKEFDCSWTWLEDCSLKVASFRSSSCVLGIGIAMSLGGVTRLLYSLLFSVCS